MLMDRRRFLQQVMLWSAGLTLQVPVFDVAGAAGEVTSSLLVVNTNTDYRRLIVDALAELGGMGSFVKPGDRVVLKPNIGWDRSPEQGANTHPMVVQTLAELALAADAREVMVFDHTCNEKRRCYANSGIQKALEQLDDRRIRLVHIDRRKFVPVDIQKGRSLTRWEIYQPALEADSYINVPVAKHHGLSGLTLGLKNSMGVIGGSRGSLHHNLGQNLADLATVIKPTLTIVDATRILLRNGPQGGRISDVKVQDTIIMSTDPVAADAYATTLFGLQPTAIDSTVAAHAMGLGEIELSKVDVRTLGNT